jgi:UDP-3-O-[3-hydroxymyristoyl] glucosamine N-acyltransferase
VIDQRFYALTGPKSVAVLAGLVPDARVVGDGGRLIEAPADAEAAGPRDVCFWEGTRGPAPEAGLIVCSDAAAGTVPSGCTAIIVRHVRYAFGAIASALAASREIDGAGGPVSPHATIGEGVRLGPGVVVAAGASIGEGAIIGANSVIGPGVQIGRRVRIGAGCVLSHCLLGDDVVVLAGAVIGEQGFGLAPAPGGARLTPHFGRVIIQDRVSVGAGVCIDRGMFADTVIGEATHIDNLCHIAHNVTVGRHVAIAAFAGIAGSSTVGDGVRMGGRSGISDHLSVGSGASVAAGAAVLRDVPPGETHAGYPAKPVRAWMRELAWLARAARKSDAGSGAEQS